MSDKPQASFLHVGICTSDLERSVEFYTRALGFETVTAIPEIPPPFDELMELPGSRFGVHQLQCGGTRIELVKFSNKEAIGSKERKPMNELGFTHMTLVYEDAAAVLERIPQYGGSVIEESKVDTDYGPIVFCTDPDGVRIEIMQAQA